MVEGLDPSTAVPNIVFGALAVLMGVIAVMFRQQIRDYTVAKERDALPKRVGDFVDSRQTPFWVGVAGAGGVVLGLVMIGFGVAALF